MRKVTIPTVVTNGHFDKEKTLAEIKRCGADRIAIAVDRELDYQFSSPETIKLVKELIQYYEANGLETLVWLGEPVDTEVVLQMKTHRILQSELQKKAIHVRFALWMSDLFWHSASGCRIWQMPVQQ